MDRYGLKVAPRKNASAPNKDASDIPTGMTQSSPQLPLEDFMQRKEPPNDCAFHPVLIQNSLYD